MTKKRSSGGEKWPLLAGGIERYRNGMSNGWIRKNLSSIGTIFSVVVSILSFLMALKAFSISRAVSEPNVKIVLDPEYLTDIDLQQAEHSKKWRFKAKDDQLRNYEETTHHDKTRHLFILVNVFNEASAIDLSDISLILSVKVGGSLDELKKLTLSKYTIDYLEHGVSEIKILAHFDIARDQYAILEIIEFRGTWKGGNIFQACGNPKIELDSSGPRASFGRCIEDNRAWLTRLKDFLL